MKTRHKTLITAAVLCLATLSPGSKASPSLRCFFGDRYERRVCSFLQSLSKEVNNESDEWLGQFKGYATCLFSSLSGWKTIQNALGQPHEGIIDRLIIGSSKIIYEGPHQYGEDYFGNIRQEIAEIPLIERSSKKTRMTVRVTCETWVDGGLKRRACDIANLASEALTVAKETADVCRTLRVSVLND